MRDIAVIPILAILTLVVLVTCTYGLNILSNQEAIQNEHPATGSANLSGGVIATAQTTLGLLEYTTYFLVLAAIVVVIMFIIKLV